MSCAHVAVQPVMQQPSKLWGSEPLPLLYLHFPYGGMQHSVPNDRVNHVCVAANLGRSTKQQFCRPCMHHCMTLSCCSGSDIFDVADGGEQKKAALTLIRSQWTGFWGQGQGHPYRALPCEALHSTLALASADPGAP